MVSCGAGSGIRHPHSPVGRCRRYTRWHAHDREKIDIGITHFLEPDFSAAVKGNPSYVETSDEKRRVMQLYANGAQVYVDDLNVFKYYKGQVSGVDTAQEVVVHKIFAPSNQQFNNPAFRDKQIRDDFNAGLKQVKSSGQYKQTVKKYINE